MANAFKWKDKPAASSNDLPREGKRIEISNRDQVDKRIDRSPVRDDVKNKFGDDYQSQYSRRAGPLEDKDRGNDADNDEGEKKRKKEKKKKAAGQQVRQPKPTNEPMIIVNVNNRLGTKSAIPCLASDTISKFYQGASRLSLTVSLWVRRLMTSSVEDFKAMVAMRIGRRPHELRLQRQGERPFKDHLTLEDYGISNGVQLDLEVDTGD